MWKKKVPHELWLQLQRWWWTRMCCLLLKGTQTFKQPQTQYPCFHFHFKVSLQVFRIFHSWPVLLQIMGPKLKTLETATPVASLAHPQKKTKQNTISFLFCEAQEKLPAMGSVWTCLGGLRIWRWLPEAREHIIQHSCTYTKTLHNDNLSWWRWFWEIMKKDDILGKGNYAWKPVKTVLTTLANCD